MSEDGEMPYLIADFDHTHNPALRSKRMIEAFESAAKLGASAGLIEFGKYLGLVGSDYISLAQAGALIYPAISVLYDVVSTKQRLDSLGKIGVSGGTQMEIVRQAITDGIRKTFGWELRGAIISAAMEVPEIQEWSSSMAQSFLSDLPDIKDPSGVFGDRIFIYPLRNCRNHSWRGRLFLAQNSRGYQYPHWRPRGQKVCK